MPYFEGRLFSEFVSLIIKLRQLHRDLGIAVVVDDLAEAWFNRTTVPMFGAPATSCAFGFDMYSLVDRVINAQKHPRTAATWKRGQQFMAANHKKAPGSDYVLHTVAWHLTPWDHTIYLDADIMPCGPINGLFELLRRFDAAMVPDPYRESGVRMPLELNYFRDSMNLVNLGMFVYRYASPGVRCLINETFNFHVAGFEYDDEKGATRRGNFGTDQEPFMGALWTCKHANIWMLQEEWICFHQETCKATVGVGGRLACKMIHKHGLYSLPEFQPKGWRS